MKIAIIAHLKTFPGPFSTSNRIEMFAKGLVEEGHCVTVVIPRKLVPGRMESIVDGYKILWQYYSSRRNIQISRLIARIKTYNWVKASVKSQQLDWILLYNLGVEGIPIAFISKRKKCKIASICGDLRYHPVNPTVEDRIRLAWIEFADFILPKLSNLNIVDTTFLERRAVKLAPKVPTLIIPPMVNVDAFKADFKTGEYYRRKHGLEKSIIIGYMGSLFMINGVKNLLIATKRLAEKGRNIKVILAGAASAGLDCDDVPRLIKDLCISEYATFVGLLNPIEVKEAMSACDILVLARIPHIINEAGAPTKLVEYLSMGKAVVVSAVGDIPKYVHDGIDAILIEAGNIDSLVEALDRVINDEELRNKLSNSARNLAIEKFYYRVAVKKICHTILEIDKKQIS